jgi:hypothetical protein
MPEKPPIYDDPDAQPTEDERAEADALRAALDGAPGSNDHADLARALHAAWSPSELSADRHERILEQALARSARPARQTGRGRVLRVVFGAGTAVALAAGVAAVIGTERAEEPAPEAAAPLATSRSTQPLFAQSFERRGGESSRIDRIALARQADLRENEFTRWGVR